MANAKGVILTIKEARLLAEDIFNAAHDSKAQNLDAVLIHLTQEGSEIKPCDLATTHTATTRRLAKEKVGV